jgi:hypothetical protein
MRRQQARWVDGVGAKACSGNGTMSVMRHAYSAWQHPALSWPCLAAFPCVCPSLRVVHHCSDMRREGGTLALSGAPVLVQC